MVNEKMVNEKMKINIEYFCKGKNLTLILPLLKIDFFKKNL